MAHSALTISSQTGRTTGAGRASSAGSPQPRPGDSFAMHMAREQREAEKIQNQAATNAATTPARIAPASPKAASTPARAVKSERAADSGAAKPRVSAAKSGKNATDASRMKAGSTAAKRQQAPRVADNPGIPLRNPTMATAQTRDFTRMQNFGKARSDLARTRAMDSYMNMMPAGTGTLGSARNLGAANNLRTIAANGNGAGFALASTDFIHTPKRRSKAERASIAARQTRKSSSATTNLGKLSARFESGSDGIAAIGYDGNGGTSYGKYQIASRVGTMKSFLSFLDNEAPDISSRLRNSGPANTGSRRGAMPDTWRAIAREQPERFERLQESFIHESHYKPALDSIVQRTGVSASSISPAMREVIWSTAVQHGPAGAARIFARADGMSGDAKAPDYERKLISNVYNLRAGQFGSSSSQIRESVRNRFRQEKELALNMLAGSTARASL